MNKTERARIANVLNAAADSLEGSKVKAFGSDPQIFVGLHLAPALGEWVDVDTDEDDLEEAVMAVVEKAKAKYAEGGRDVAEEWMISDYNDFPNLGENPSFADLAKTAQLLADHDSTAVQAAFEMYGNDVDQAETLLDNGYSMADSEEDYAYELIDSMGGTSELSAEIVSRYVDYKKLARDLSHDVNFVTVGGTPYAFYNH
jgi:antirestriction protein